MEHLQNLEVVINRRGAKYRASSPAFPRCFGDAETVPVAVKKLAGSIARYIGRAAHDALDGVFESDNFTELLLDTTSPHNEERRIYSFNKIQSQMGRSLMVRVQPKQTLLPQRSSDKALPSIRSMVPAEMMPEFAELFDDDEPQAHDGIIFGFPLNFN